MIAVISPLSDAVMSTLYAANLIAWVIPLFRVFQDILRSGDLTGATTVISVLLVHVVTLLGCLLYLIVRNDAMHLRQDRASRVQREAFESLFRHVVSSGDAKESKVLTP